MIIDQPSMFEPEEGARLRDRGMALADEAADVDWKDAWRQAITLLAGIGDPFTSDDVRAIAGEPWDHANATGSLFNAAARQGVIRRIGYRQSDRATRHKNVVALWIGADFA
jgi:hypothetical protein